MKILLFLLSLASAVFPACSGKRQASPAPVSVLAEAQPPNEAFGTYWFQGKGEICNYDVKQMRYGEIRSAQQIMIFVTEDFSARRHVKLDNPENAGDDRVPVLKCNLIRRFTTGIYDYSLMQSVFTPYDATRHSRTLKTTTSIQDWCGQAFMQFDAGEKGYTTRHFSYFESEGDVETSLPMALLEDELWTRIRINPETLPIGRASVIPSAIYGRLLHKPLLAYTAEINIQQLDTIRELNLQYLDIPRKLVIRFDAAFPFRIREWEEYDGETMLSSGILQEYILLPYWQLNRQENEGARNDLDVHFFKK